VINWKNLCHDIILVRNPSVVSEPLDDTAPYSFPANPTVTCSQVSFSTRNSTIDTACPKYLPRLYLTFIRAGRGICIRLDFNTLTPSRTSCPGETLLTRPVAVISLILGEKTLSIAWQNQKSPRLAAVQSLAPLLGCIIQSIIERQKMPRTASPHVFSSLSLLETEVPGNLNEIKHLI